MIDSHIHLDDERFDSERFDLLASAREAGIKGFVVPATGVWGFDKIKQLASENPDIYPAYGLHPYYVNKHKPESIEELSEFLSNNNAVALGECGLDYYKDGLDRDKQQTIFEQQVSLAKECNLPLILHVNAAVQAVFKVLKKHNYYNAVMHSFNGSVEQARQITDAGVKLGFGTAVVNPEAHKLHRVVKSVDLSDMVIETDAPDQPLYDAEESKNLPICLRRVAEYIAELKQTSFQQLSQRTAENCERLFNL